MKIIEGTIATPKGFYATGIHAGLKKRKKDLGLIYSDVPAQAAAVYTTNQVQAAPIFLTKQAMENGVLQAILVNSGNANACTGAQGLADAKEMQLRLAQNYQLPATHVAVASTGVIGQKLPMEKILSGIDQLEITGNTAQHFSEAILTTDTITKEIVATDVIDQTTITVAAVAKGSGMIHPNMATMLCFVTTDATISSSLLQEMLSQLTEHTFNQITVDGDTSTNDMVLVLANGAAGGAEIQKNTPAYQQFYQMLANVCSEMAQQIAKDGEGATKLIEVRVTGATTTSDARLIAKKVVGSTLVKTAIFGEDPNWGRIICAVGYAGAKIQPEKIDMEIEGETLVKSGQPQSVSLDHLRKKLAKEKIVITVHLHLGEAQGTAWGCDLTYDYVKINALYHT